MKKAFFHRTIVLFTCFVVIVGCCCICSTTASAVSSKVTAAKLAYDTILSQYRILMKNDWNYDEELQDINHEVIGSSRYYDDFCVYYAYEDIDNNGTPELIIGAGDSIGKSIQKYDIFSYHDNEAIHTFDAEFGYRTYFTVYSSGIIEIYASGSAYDHSYNYYKISKDGYMPQVIESVFTVWDHDIGSRDNGTVNYYYSLNDDYEPSTAKKISKAEYDKIVKKYSESPLYNINWIKLSDSITENDNESLFRWFNDTWVVTQFFNDTAKSNMNLYGHLGIDIVGSGKTVNIFPIYPGEVIHAKYTSDNGNGYSVTLKHEINGTTFYSLYSHLTKDLKVKKGDKVTTQTTLGYMGSSGNSGGPHLHFAVYQTNSETIAADMYGYNDGRKQFAEVPSRKRGNYTFWDPFEVWYSKAKCLSDNRTTYVSFGRSIVTKRTSRNSLAIGDWSK